jgi:NADPH:quinone reductase-like Zn-dependent oxidoreductase
MTKAHTFMKAVICSKYGSPEDLKVKEVPVPVPKENEVRIKVHATAINDYDWSLVRGKPYPYRLLFGMRKPKNQIPGMELSGIIDAIGTGVKTFKVGDEVFGDISGFGFGSFATYVCIDERAVVPKPHEMSHEEAASLPHASLLAWQGLIDIGKIKKGQKILINGAGGGVGTLGLQIAKMFDAEVTGVDNGNKLQMMKEIGFDHVIDYKKEDFTKQGVLYDVILDCKTSRATPAYARTLKPGGIYVTVGGKLGRLLQAVVTKSWISFTRKKKIKVLALKSNQGLDQIINLYRDGKIKPVIDGPYRLEEIPQLIRYFGEGKHKGKVIISLSNNDKPDPSEVSLNF